MQKPDSSRKQVVILGIVAALVLVIAAYIWKSYELDAPYRAFHEGVVVLKNHQRPSEGYWTGDVAELHRMGLIPKAIAEADVAPIQRLLDRPRPFHGYYFVAMDTGSSEKGWTEDPTSLKKATWNKSNYAYCMFPDENGKANRPLYIICPNAVFRKESNGSGPQMRWPDDIGNSRSGWWLVD